MQAGQLTQQQVRAAPCTAPVAPSCRHRCRRPGVGAAAQAQADAHRVGVSPTLADTASPVQCTCPIHLPNTPQAEALMAAKAEEILANLWKVGLTSYGIGLLVMELVLLLWHWSLWFSEGQAGCSAGGEGPGQPAEGGTRRVCMRACLAVAARGAGWLQCRGGPGQPVEGGSTSCGAGRAWLWLSGGQAGCGSRGSSWLVCSGGGPWPACGRWGGAWADSWLAAGCWLQGRRGAEQRGSGPAGPPAHAADAGRAPRAAHPPQVNVKDIESTLGSVITAVLEVGAAGGRQRCRRAAGLVWAGAAAGLGRAPARSA